LNLSNQSTIALKSLPSLTNEEPVPDLLYDDNEPEPRSDNYESKYLSIEESPLQISCRNSISSRMIVESMANDDEVLVEEARNNSVHDIIQYGTSARALKDSSEVTILRGGNELRANTIP
jgi:hypothetical protein